MSNPGDRDLRPLLTGWLAIALMEAAFGRQLMGAPSVTGALAELALLGAAGALQVGLWLALGRALPWARVADWPRRLRQTMESAGLFGAGAPLALTAFIGAYWHLNRGWSLRGLRDPDVALQLGGVALLCLGLAWVAEQLSRWRPRLATVLAVALALWAVPVHHAQLALFRQIGFLGESQRTLLRSATWALPMWFALLGVAWRREGGAMLIAALLTPMVAVRPKTGRWSGEAGDAQPPVILILADTLRAKEAHEMETYQRLAEGGSAFSDALAPAGWTLPSMGTLMTGVTPERHGALRLGERWMSLGELDPSRPRLAEGFAEGGYTTAGVVCNPFLTRQYGFRDGFGEWRQAHESAPASPIGLTLLGRAADLDPLYKDHVDGAHMVDEALDWIDHRPDGPFFLWLHVLDVHLPYFHADIPEQSPLREVFGRRPGRELSITHVRRGNMYVRDEIEDEVRALYQQEVDYLDGQLMRFLDGLEERGLFDTAVIAMTSDHGEEFWEHDGFEHAHTLYEELVHIPLVMRWPGGVTEQRNDPVGLVDLMPTMLQSADLPVPDDLDGVDIREKQPTDRLRHLRSTLYFYERDGVVRGDWKLVRGMATGELELYHRRFGELDDYVTEEPELVEELEAELREIEVRQSNATGDMDALRSMGYVH